MGRVYNAASGTRTFTLPFSRIPLLWDEMFVPSDVSHPHSPSSRHPFHVCVCVFSQGPYSYTHTLNHTHIHTHTCTHTRTMRGAEIERFQREILATPGMSQANTINVPTSCMSVPGSNPQSADRLTVLFLGPYGLEYISFSPSLFSLLFHLSFDISNSEINKIW